MTIEHQMINSSKIPLCPPLRKGDDLDSGFVKFPPLLKGG